MKPADLIWNRACFDTYFSPRAGDIALRALLRAHGLTMNGGVFHAIECLSDSELLNAIAGYRFFGLDSAVEVLLRAKRLIEEKGDLGSQEVVLDKAYAAVIPDDSFIVQRFKQHLESHPLDFAPL